MVLSLNDDEMNAWAQRIDVLLDRGDVAPLQGELDRLRKAVGEIESPFQRAALVLSQTNILSTLRELKARHEPPTRWEWNSLELLEEVRALRSAGTLISTVPFDVDRTDLRFRIWTNLGSLFSDLGRASEALEWWDKTLTGAPDYLMAVGNKGYGLSAYARSLFDPGHRHVFMKHAHGLLQRAVEGSPSSYPLEPHAKVGLTEHLQEIRSLGDWSKFEYHQDGFSLGRSAAERRYRQWCLKHRLFVNPLNDVEEGPISSHDCLAMPSLFVPIKEGSSSPPSVFAFYSQLKREFASARYMLFEASEESDDRATHFSDRGLHLTNALDYRIHRGWVDKVKMAFSMAYSALDKLGPFINLHWRLGHDPVRIDFRKVWLASNKKNAGLHPTFEVAENWPLRGLYWLSRDLFLDSADEPAMDPEAAALLDLRHQITHRYLSVHDLATATPSFEGHYAISGNELQAKALKMLRLVRSALLYVSLAAHADEQKKEDARGNSFVMDVYTVPDRDL